MRIHDLTSGEEVNRLAVALQPNPLRYDPSGNRLAGNSASSREVHVVQAESGEIVAKLPHLDNSIVAVAWSPDGHLLAAAGSDTRIRLWDVAAAKELKTLDGHVGTVTSLAFSGSGHLLASKGYDSALRLWDPWTGRQHVQFDSRYGVQFSRDDRRLVYQHGSRQGLLSLAAGLECRKLPGTEQGAGAGAIRPDGRLLATASSAQGLQFFDLVAGRLVASLPVGSSYSTCFDSKTGDLLTSGTTGALRWPVERADEASLGVRFGPPRSLGVTVAHPWHSAFSSESRRMAVAVDRGPVAVVNVDNPSEKVLLKPHPGMWSVAISPDGQWVATGPWNGQLVRIWNAKTGEHVLDLPGTDQIVNGRATLRFSPDGEWLVTGFVREYRFWKVSTWEPGLHIPRNHSGDIPGTMEFSPDSAVLAIDYDSHAIRLIECATGDQLATLETPHADTASPLCFSHDGTQLVVSTEKSLHVWDLRLIRQQLAEIGLDWHQPTYAPADDPPPSEPIRVTVLPGQLTQANLRQAMQYNARQEYAKAIAEFEKVLEIDPDQPLALNNLAWLLGTTPEPFRDPIRALPLAQKAVALEPQNWSSLNTLGVVYYRLDRFQNAIEALERAGAANKDGATAFEWFFLAMSHHQLGDPAKSEDCYKKALEWRKAQSKLSPGWAEELDAFQAEAEAVMKIK